MTYREAFDETVKLFGLRASDIASKSGIGENQISRFRHGKTDLQTESLEKLIDGLPQNAKAYFYSMVMVGSSQ
jgi:transcriptional regulator with XRE-family HTH domain